MKKMRFLLIPLFCLMFIKGPLLKAFAQSEISEEVYLNQVFDEEEIIDIQGEVVLTVFRNSDKNYVKLYRNGFLVKTIEGSYQTHTWDNDYLWLATADSFYKINRQSFQAEIGANAFGKVNQLQLRESDLWLVGEKSNNAIIARLDYAFKELKTYYFGGDAFEEFTALFWFDDIPYVFGQKDAHSLNGPFAHVGSKGERKPFVARLNKSFQIEQTVYFNHESGDERLYDAYFSEKGLFFLVKTKSTFHYYRLDLDLTCLEHEVYSGLNSLIGMLSPSGFYVLLKETPEGIVWDVACRAVEDDQTIGTGSVVSGKIENGCLVVCLKESGKIVKKTIEEYHIKRHDPLYLSYWDEENLTKNTEVESYFEPLTVSVKEVDPYFEKTMPGEYEATFNINRLNGQTLELKQKITVLPYVNVIDQGIYGLPFTLAFFGKGYLNGERIHSGYIIETPGEYELVILDGYGRETTYRFYAVANYPRKNGHIPADYYVEKGEKVSVRVELENPAEIDRIIVNGSSHPFTQSGKTLFLELTPGEGGLSVFEITEAFSNQGQVIPVNQTIRVAVLRAVPEIIVKEETGDNLKLSFDIADSDNALAALEMVVYKDSQALSARLIFLENDTLSVSLPEKGIYRVEINALVERGDGIWQRKQLFSYKGDFSKPNVTFASLSFERTGRIIESAGLEVNAPAKAMTPQEITVLSQNITSRYQNKGSLLPLIVSLGFTGLIIVLFGVNYFKKKRAKNTQND
jgi:hypothetical protein